MPGENTKQTNQKTDNDAQKAPAEPGREEFLKSVQDDKAAEPTEVQEVKPAEKSEPEVTEKTPADGPKRPESQV